MTPSRPYLVRAFYEWIVDNDMTPFILVQADQAGVFLPPDIADDENKVYLNVGASACANIEISNSAFAFSARFSGASFDCSIPIKAIKAICSRENGRGMVFPETDDDYDGDEPPPPTSQDKKAASKSRPTLTVVK